MDPNAADYLRDTATHGVDRALEEVTDSSDFDGLDELVADLTTDLPDAEPYYEEETVTEGTGSESYEAKYRELEEKYNMALDELSKHFKQAPQTQTPQPTGPTPEEQAAQKREVYDKYKSTRDLTDDEISMLEDRIGAVMEATGKDASPLNEQVKFLTQVVEALYLDNEKARLQNSFDKELVDKYYESAMRLVAAGKVPNVEDGMLLLNARASRTEAAKRPKAPPASTVLDQRQAAASQNAPTPRRAGIAPHAANTSNLGAADYLKQALKNRLR